MNIGSLTAYLNRQASRLSTGNLTDQRVGTVLAQTAVSLQEDVRLGFSILNSKSLGELAIQM